MGVASPPGWSGVFLLSVTRPLEEDLLGILCLHGLGVGGMMEKKGKYILDVLSKLFGVGLTDFL